jgi:putative ABC transport system substrate-binding protein
MSRPTGNVTGISQLNVEVGPKRLEIARELLPAKNDIALLVDPNNPQHEAIVKDAKKEATIWV